MDFKQFLTEEESTFKATLEKKTTDLHDEHVKAVGEAISKIPGVANLKIKGVSAGRITGLNFQYDTIQFTYEGVKAEASFSISGFSVDVQLNVSVAGQKRATQQCKSVKTLEAAMKKLVAK